MVQQAQSPNNGYISTLETQSNDIERSKGETKPNVMYSFDGIWCGNNYIPKPVPRPKY